MIKPFSYVAVLLACLGAASGCHETEAVGAEASPTAAVAAPVAAATPEGAVPANPTSPGQVPASIATVLEAIKAKDAAQLAISPEDGQFLRMLVAATGRKRALEIGSAMGYSAIWIGMGLRDTGGHLVTIEFDPGRARQAKENVEKAGLSDVVQVIAGDAFQEIPKLSSTFDCVFVDAWKRDYIKFFEMTWPRLDKGGIFLGHNVINKKSEMGDFLARISTHPDLFTSIVAPGGEGVSVSYRRR